MDHEELGFAIKGVVRNGQVVLETPLDAPDGTVVTIRPCDRSGVSSQETQEERLAEDEARWLEEEIAWFRARAARRTAETRVGPRAA